MADLPSDWRRRVTPLADGSYRVQGRHSIYHVRDHIGDYPYEELDGDLASVWGCDCPAGRHGRDPCWHVRAVVAYREEVEEDP